MDYRRPEQADLERRNLYRLERRQRRMAAVLAMSGARALDHEDLAHAAASGDVSARGNVIRRRLVVRALLDAGVSHGDLATWWGVSGDEIEADRRAPLLDQTGIAPSIDRELAELYPDVIEGYSLADRAARAQPATPAPRTPHAHG